MKDWLSLIWLLVCVVAIIGLAFWFTRYVVGRGALNGLGMSPGTEQFRVLARLNLGREQMLILVQAGERCFLLGVTPSAISTLAEFTQEEAELWQVAQEPPDTPNFREALRMVLRQKKR